MPRCSTPALRTVKLEGRPGERSEYSNWGIALLGHFLENAYGQPYTALLSRHITGPLRMVSTTYKPVERQRNRAAVGYFENGRLAPYQDSGMFGPAGDILSNLDDMLLYQGATDRKYRFHRTDPSTDGERGWLGVGCEEENDHREIQHNGSTNGFTAHVSGFLDSKSGCVILTNSKVGLGELIAAIHAQLKTKLNYRSFDHTFRFPGV